MAIILGDITKDEILVVGQSGLESLLDHDDLQGFVADEHVAHSGISVIAGTLLTGGGTIDASVTLNVDEASIDHGSVAGLGDDDHEIYLLADGTRGLSGTWSIGSAWLLFNDDYGFGWDWSPLFYGSSAAGAEYFRIDMPNQSQALYIDRNGLAFIPGGLDIGSISSNSKMTVGVTVDQGAADDEAIAAQSSDVVHGLTDYADTTTFFCVRKYNDLVGGTEIRSIAEDASTNAVFVISALGGQADTTKGASGRAQIELNVYEHDGANALANITANGNIFGVRAYVSGALTTRYHLDEDGDSWQSGSPTFGGDHIIISTFNPPASAGASGQTGEIRCDSSGYIYLCIATNTWVRVQLSTWS